MIEQVEIVAINISKRWAVSSSGECWLFTDFYDADGVETLDPDFAVCGICTRNGKEEWITLDLTLFDEEESLH